MHSLDLKHLFMATDKVRQIQGLLYFYFSTDLLSPFAILQSALSELRQSHEDVLCKKEELLRGCDERIASLETKLNERVEQSHQVWSLH